MSSGLLGSFISWFFFYMPWLIIGLFAALAWSKHRKSLPLILQALGAFGIFVISIMCIVVNQLFSWMHVSLDVWRASYTIFSFLSVVALVLFMAGFCWEKLRQWRNSGTPAAAFPVQ